MRRAGCERNIHGLAGRKRYRFAGAGQTQRRRLKNFRCERLGACGADQGSDMGHMQKGHSEFAEFCV